MQPRRNILNDRYELTHLAGSGGMSTVYKGRDLLLGRRVAIKVMHASLTSDQEFVRRFQKEAHSAANLTHPNIVTVHDIGQEGRRYYIVMEFVEGWTLKELIRRYNDQTGNPLPFERSMDMAIQICAGIGYAHRANLVHCDVKSQNVLVSTDQRVKVTDFGIARALSETTIHDPDVVWGTPQYFSPEQAAGEAPTPASDVYSIGVIMFEMFSGRLPFDAESHTAYAVKHMQETPVSVSTYNPLIPVQVDRIVAKVMSKEPSGRYRTADQLGRVLTSYREHSLETTGPLITDVSHRDGMAERKTEFYLPTIGTPSGTGSTEHTPRPSQDTASLKPDIHYPVPDSNETDWLAISLGIVAFISLLGLIPLWYLVYTRFAG